LKLRTIATSIALMTSVVASPAQAAESNLGPVAGRAGLAADVPSSLAAGERLVARSNRDSLSSPSGEFLLRLSSGSLALDQLAPITGRQGQDTVETGVWLRDFGRGRPVAPRDRTALQLQRNGNLRLVTERGRVLWSTHTKGTGAHNRLVVRNDGNLVMYTAAGKRVWASRTTRVFLGAGESLVSGDRMVSRWGEQSDPSFKLVTLTMQRDGNLVYRCRHTVNWSTHTRVPGSQLDMQDNGNAVVHAPNGRRLWSSHTAGTAWAYFAPVVVYSVGPGPHVVWAPRLPDPLHC
jgi:hypothetical protein